MLAPTAVPETLRHYTRQRMQAKDVTPKDLLELEGFAYPITYIGRVRSSPLRIYLDVKVYYVLNGVEQAKTYSPLAWCTVWRKRKTPK